METLIALNFHPELLHRDPDGGLKTWFVVDTSTRTFGDLMEQIRAQFSISSGIELRDQDGFFIPPNAPLELVFAKVKAMFCVLPANMPSMLGYPVASSTPTPSLHQSRQVMMLLLSPLRGNPGTGIELPNESVSSEHRIELPDEPTHDMDVAIPEVSLNITNSSLEWTTLNVPPSDTNDSVFGSVDRKESVEGIQSVSQTEIHPVDAPNSESAGVALDRPDIVEKDSSICVVGSLNRSQSEESTQRSKRLLEESPSRSPSKRLKLFMEDSKAVSESNSGSGVPQPSPKILADHHLEELRTCQEVISAYDPFWIPLDLSLIGQVNKGTLLAFTYNENITLLAQLEHVRETALVVKVIPIGKFYEFDLARISMVRRTGTIEEMWENELEML